MLQENSEESSGEQFSAYRRLKTQWNQNCITKPRQHERTGYSDRPQYSNHVCKHSMGLSVSMLYVMEIYDIFVLSKRRLQNPIMILNSPLRQDLQQQYV